MPTWDMAYTKICTKMVIKRIVRLVTYQSLTPLSSLFRCLVQFFCSIFISGYAAATSWLYCCSCCLVVQRKCPSISAKPQYAAASNAITGKNGCVMLNSFPPKFPSKNSLLFSAPSHSLACNSGTCGESEKSRKLPHPCQETV